MAAAVKKYRTITPEEAVGLVRDGDWIEYGFGAGYAELLDRALAARKGELKDVRIRGGLMLAPRLEAVECDPEQESFHYYSDHIGETERKLQSRGLVRFVPLMLREMPGMLRRGDLRTDVAFVPVSKPDENGVCSTGLSPFCWRVIAENARTVIFEINEHYPVLFGSEGLNATRLPLSMADAVVEGEHSPVPTRSYRASSETDLAIARLVMQEIPDGACLGLGVGGVPFAVASMLAESDLKDLGCWTGTISDPFMKLYEAGTLTMTPEDCDGAVFGGVSAQVKCRDGAGSAKLQAELHAGVVAPLRADVTGRYLLVWYDAAGNYIGKTREYYLSHNQFDFPKTFISFINYYWF